MVSFVRFRDENKVITELKNVKRSTHIRDRNKVEIFEDDTMVCDSEDGLHLCKVVFEESRQEYDQFLSGFKLKILKELNYEDFEEIPYFDVVKGEEL